MPTATGRPRCRCRCRSDRTRDGRRKEQTDPVGCARRRSLGLLRPVEHGMARQDCRAAKRRSKAPPIPSFACSPFQRRPPGAAEDVKPAGWQGMQPESVPKTSRPSATTSAAICRRRLNVPVGLIHTSWGGTPAQAWTSKESLDAVPAQVTLPRAVRGAKGHFGSGKGRRPSRGRHLRRRRPPPPRRKGWQARAAAAAQPGDPNKNPNTRQYAL